MAHIPKLIRNTLSISDHFVYVTMLNEESRQSWAVTKKELKTLAIVTDKQFGENEIQVWKYNSKMLSTEGVVDKLSLYLSLKDNEDERIQIELERLINEMSW